MEILYELKNIKNIHIAMKVLKKLGNISVTEDRESSP